MVAADCDNETFIFRRFNELGARNLLYLQTELLVLEAQLKKMDDATLDVSYPDHPDLKDAQRDWRELVRQSSLGNEKFVKRMNLVHELRGKIKEYRKHRSRCVARRGPSRKDADELTDLALR